MGRHVALLRAVNVGGSGKLPMATLRETLESVGLTAVRTLLASGNAVFETKRTSTAPLEADIERALAERAGIETEVMVRSAASWAALIAANPMSARAIESPGKSAVMVMKTGPDLGALDSYLEKYTGPEMAAVGDRCIYLYFADGMGKSKLRFPKGVGTGTVRNWNTTEKIAAALGVNQSN